MTAPIFDGLSEDAGMADIPTTQVFAERGDAVEQWLRAKRDMWIEDGPSWHTVDEILTDYRIHADHQVPLDEPTPDKRVMAYSEMSLAESAERQALIEAGKLPGPDGAYLSTTQREALETLRRLNAEADARWAAQQSEAAR